VILLQDAELDPALDSKVVAHTSRAPVLDSAVSSVLIEEATDGDGGDPLRSRRYPCSGDTTPDAEITSFLELVQMFRGLPAILNEE
jgi:hypothetical protein